MSWPDNVLSFRSTFEAVQMNIQFIFIREIAPDMRATLGCDT